MAVHIKIAAWNACLKTFYINYEFQYFKGQPTDISSHVLANTYAYIYIYIYIYVCVCVCVCIRMGQNK